MVKIGYMGIPLSNSEAATKGFVERMCIDATLIPLMSSENVINALESKKIDLGVVAFENTIAGYVEETLKAIKGRDWVEVVDELDLPIHHFVFVRDPSSRIKVIASHIHALMQSSGSIKRLYPDAKMLPVDDTAYAAEMLANGELDASHAVICKREAGEFHGLILAHEHVEDEKDNITTFRLIKRA